MYLKVAVNLEYFLSPFHSAQLLYILHYDSRISALAESRVAPPDLLRSLCHPRPVPYASLQYRGLPQRFPNR